MNTVQLKTWLIDNDLETSFKEIYSSKGRVAVTGIGKRDIIANKIVAAFNTAGIPSMLIHATDAIQADLGNILPADTVICVSKSSNKPEIKPLVFILKRTSSKLVAIVSQIRSYLVRTDYVMGNCTILLKSK